MLRSHGLVAQRQTPAPLGGRKQVVPREPQQNRVLGIAMADNQSDKPENFGVFDFAGDQSFRDLMVDRREELADVVLQDILVPAGKPLAAVDGGVGTFPLAASVAVEAKRSFKDRLKNFRQGVMNATIPGRH